MLPCHQEQRYATHADADAVRRGQIGTFRLLSPYYCPAHGCWHLGRDRRASKRTTRFDWSPHLARGFVNQHRAQLVAEFHRTHDAELWQGVRVLSRVLIHLAR